MNNDNVLERGDIYFFYRPKVEKIESKSLDEVERFYLILHPFSEEKYRLIVMGGKTMPQIEGSNRISWSFVESVGDKPEEVEDQLDRKEYATKTKGHRFIEAVRPVGEGVYTIAKHDDHTHLAYVLELPEKPGKVQDAFNIKKQASYVVSVKNPEAPTPKSAGVPPVKTSFPKNLQEKFQYRKFGSVNPPQFFDYKGAQFLFIGATEDVKHELGIELQPEKETEATAEIFNNLHLEKNQHKTEPLFWGKWV